MKLCSICIFSLTGLLLILSSVPGSKCMKRALSNPLGYHRVRSNLFLSPVAKMDEFRTIPGGMLEREQSQRPQLPYNSSAYRVTDPIRTDRVISFFDPEAWVAKNPNIVFPTQLDIPFGWSIYNPVTVQAPLPAPIDQLKEMEFTGFYYTCPNNVDPHEYSWMFGGDYRPNPCRWSWYIATPPTNIPNQTKA